MESGKLTPQAVYEKLRTETDVSRAIIIRAILENDARETPPAQAYMARWREGKLTPAEIALIDAIADGEVGEDDLVEIAAVLADTQGHKEGLGKAIAMVLDHVRGRFAKLTGNQAGEPREDPRRRSQRQGPGLFSAMLLRRRHEQGGLSGDHIRAVMLLLGEAETGTVNFEQCIAAIEKALETGVINAENKRRFREDVEKILKLSPIVLGAITTKEELEKAIYELTKEEARRANKIARDSERRIDGIRAPEPARIKQLKKAPDDSEKTPGRQSRARGIFKTLFDMGDE